MDKMRLKWFKNRIGKRIYPPVTECECVLCKYIREHGVYIRDAEHAQQLAILEIDLNTRYYDTKQQSNLKKEK